MVVAPVATVVLGVETLHEDSDTVALSVDAEVRMFVAIPAVHGNGDSAGAIEAFADHVADAVTVEALRVRQGGDQMRYDPAAR